MCWTHRLAPFDAGAMTTTHSPAPVTDQTTGGAALVTVATALDPAVWGTTYFVTTAFLPADHPLFAALMRALPAGLLGLLIARRLPHGDWWWKTLVLGTLNIGIFFPLLFVAAERLPGGVAATLGATQHLPRSHRPRRGPLSVVPDVGPHRHWRCGHGGAGSGCRLRPGRDPRRHRRSGGDVIETGSKPTVECVITYPSQNTWVLRHLGYETTSFRNA